MMKDERRKKGLVWLFISLLLVLTPLFWPIKTFAQQQFTSSYSVTYDIDQTGLTTVTEQITLKNLTDQYYASSFSLLIDATNISNVEASDNGGNLQTSLNREGPKTKINVDFGQQIAGKNKTYSFELDFKSTDFAQKHGEIWQVSIPRIASASDIDSYQMTLMVPDSFGDPGSILPAPVKQSDTGGKLQLNFNKDQLKDTGILANFGTNQLLSFDLTYHLKNSSILPSVDKISIPANSDYQQVEIDDISPKPDNVTVDSDGNYLAWFKLNRLETKDVEVKGLGRLFISSQSKLPFLLSKQEEQTLTSPNKYWESDNPLIQAKLSDIFKNGMSNMSNQQKAQAINNYVVNSLTLNQARLGQHDFTRLGAITTLNNPDDALANDFADLFVAFARAANVPSRELVGYAYSSNKDLRPITLNNSLHVWVEYYDSNLGWIMVDPTWQNTTGGVDYFSKFDLNHLVLATRGYSSTDPGYPDGVKVDFSSSDFNPLPHLQFTLDGPSQFYAGFPSSMDVVVENSGSALQPTSLLSLKAGQITIPGQNNFSTPEIPPFGHLDYKFDLRTPSLLSSFDDQVTLSVGNQQIQRQVEVRPFFTFKLFPLMVIVTVGIIAAIYIAVLGLHLYQHKEHYFKKKK